MKGKKDNKNVSDNFQMLDLADKDFHAAIIKMFKRLREIMF